MNNLNSVLLEGNLVRDALRATTPSGNSVTNFTIAVNRYTQKKGSTDGTWDTEVSFFDIETWGNLADTCDNKGRKGTPVRVVGRMKQERWMGKDGQNHSKVVVVAEHVEFRKPLLARDEDEPEDANADFLADTCDRFVPIPVKEGGAA